MNGFTFWKSYYESGSKLPPEMEGEFYKAIVHYAFSGEAPADDGIISALFCIVKPLIDKAVSRSQAGSIKKDELKTNKNQNKIKNESQQKQTNNKEKIIHKEEIEEIINAWNSDPQITHIREIRTGSPRERSLKLRLKTYGKKTLLDAIKRVNSSKFCHGGGSTGWVADFDWFVKPDTIDKILEGKYDDRIKQGSNAYIDTIKSRVSEVDKWV
jgi:hypothetical protein